MRIVASYILKEIDSQTLVLTTSWVLKLVAVAFLAVFFVVAPLQSLQAGRMDWNACMVIISTGVVLILLVLCYQSGWIFDSRNGLVIRYRRVWPFRTSEKVYEAKDIEAIKLVRPTDVATEYSPRVALYLVMRSGRELFLDSTKNLRLQKQRARMLCTLFDKKLVLHV